MSLSKQTALLSPALAVRLTWARTGAFTNDDYSKAGALRVEAAIKEIKLRAGADPAEKDYVEGALNLMEAAMRSLDTVYKGRNNNFDENAKLRESNLETIKEGLEFGTKAKDFLKSLPTVGITVGAGTISLADMLGSEADNTALALAALVLAGVGYLIHAVCVVVFRKSRQRLYVRQDYERDLYYEQYLSRVRLVLTDLLIQVECLHVRMFGQAYPPCLDGEDPVELLLKGIRPTYCKHVHRHMADGTITPHLWALCESGSAAHGCPKWK